MSVRNPSFERKLSLNQGFIVPVQCQEVLPNDDVRHKVDVILRTQQLQAPVYHSAEVKFHTYFVPARLCWDNFDKFITGGEDGLNESVPPTIDVGGAPIASGSLSDHLGLPQGQTVSEDVSALPFRAYALIYNEYYRDQDLQDPVPLSTADGEDVTTSTVLKRACWQKDYFTTCRPDTQKGDDVTIALTGDAPILGLGKQNQTFSDTDQNVHETDGDGTVTYDKNIAFGGAAPNGTIYLEEDPDNAGYPNLRADLSNVAAVDINTIRLAASLQRYKENMLKFGARYTERLQAAFGVKNPDARLQRPEYLGGGKSVIQFSEIIQSAPSIDDTSAESVGTLKGHGITVLRENKYRRRVPEYGFLITVMVVRPKTAYQEGVHRMWSRLTKEDYFQPELQHIGMQQVKKREIYAGSSNPDDVFGYQNRYDEYRHMFDQVSGELNDTLDYWHMARQFGSEPSLNGSFVECEGVDRPFSTNADEFVARVFHKIKIKNNTVSKTGTPRLF